jgi:hypothetical protein
MGEEGTNYRLIALEKGQEKSDKNQCEMTDKIIVIEKLNILQSATLKLIMWFIGIMAGTFVAFVASNMFMYFNSLKK